MYCIRNNCYTNSANPTGTTTFPTTRHPVGSTSTSTIHSLSHLQLAVYLDDDKWRISEVDRSNMPSSYQNISPLHVDRVYYAAMQNVFYAEGQKKIVWKLIRSQKARMTTLNSRWRKNRSDLVQILVSSIEPPSPITNTLL